jgi:hypothetical protein
VLSYLKRHHIGIIALFIALGGTAYAVTRRSSNSAGSGQLHAGAVTAAQTNNETTASAKLSPAAVALLRKRNSRAEAPWRDPGILASIRSAGQTIVAHRIVAVAATAPWVDTGLSVTADERLWSDTRTDGKWSGNPRLFPYADANGLSAYPGQYRVDAKAAVESLIGFIGGSPPTPPEVSVSTSAPAGGPGGMISPGYIEAGNTLLDFAPVTTGAVWFRNNDNTNYYSDVGQQIVKVIVTRP